METKKDILDFIQPKKRESIDNSYFENLASNVILTSKIQNPKIVKPLFRRSVFWLSSIAAVALILLITRFYNQNGQIESDFSSISESDLIAYIDNNIEDFDQDLLADYLPIYPVDSVKKKGNITQPEIKKIKSIEEKKMIENENEIDLFENINTEDILKYLENEGISPEEIEESVNI